MASNQFLAAKVLSVSVLTVLVLISSVRSVVQVGPSDVTVKLGQNASFQCTTAVGDKLVWRDYEPSTIIYIESSNTNNNPSKYRVISNNPNYNMTVISTQLSDGSPFSCKTAAETDEAYANLVVISSLTATVYPPSNSRSVNDQVVFNCTLTFGGPITSDTNKALSASQNPTLQMLFGGRDVTSDPSCILTEITIDSTHPNVRSKIRTFNKTLQTGDAANTLKCYASSLSYQDSAETTMNMNYQTRNVNISSNQTGGTSFYVGDILNCTADGFPFPSVTWSQTTSTGCKNVASISTQNKGYALLQFGSSCSGTSTWNCTATGGSPSGSAMKSITVSVGGGSGPDQGPTGQARALVAHFSMILLITVVGYLLNTPV